MAYFNELMISSEENPPDPPSVDAEYEHILLQQIDLFGLWDRVGMPRYPKIRWENPRHQHELVTDRFSDDINIAFSNKRVCLPHVLGKNQSLERRFLRDEPNINKFASGDVKDVITLNVSGTIMTTKRSTLLFFKESVLAQQLDDSKWKEHGYKSTLVKKWPADEVCNWANNIDGIQENVGSIFKENGITGCELLSLNIEGLKMLGIKRVGLYVSYRRKLKCL